MTGDPDGPRPDQETAASPDGPGLDPRQLTQSALAALTPEDTEQALTTLPTDIRRRAMAVIGRRPASRPSPRIAENLLRHLRYGQRSKRWELQMLFVYPLWFALDNPDGLPAADHAALLDPATAPQVLERAPALAHAFAIQAPLPPAYLRLGVTTALTREPALAPLAIGLLQAEADRFGPDLAKALHEAWRRLRADDPALPETPLDTSTLCAHAAASTHSPNATPADTPTDPALADSEDLATEAPTADTNPTAVAPPTSARTPPAADVISDAETEPPAKEATAMPVPPMEPQREIEALRIRLQDARERFDAAAEAIGTVSAALWSGRRPADDELAALTTAVQAFDDLREAIAALGGRPAEPTLDALAEALRAAGERAGRTVAIRALTTLTGPSILKAPLNEIRRAAATGAGEGLAELAELIGLCARDDHIEHFDRIDRLARTARERLPDQQQAVVTAAISRLLSVSPADPDPHAGSDNAPQSDGGETNPDPPPGTDGGPTADPTPGPAEEKQPPANPVPPPRPAPEDTTAPAPISPKEEQTTSPAPPSRPASKGTATTGSPGKEQTPKPIPQPRPTPTAPDSGSASPGDERPTEPTPPPRATPKDTAVPSLTSPEGERTAGPASPSHPTPQDTAVPEPGSSGEKQTAESVLRPRPVPEGTTVPGPGRSEGVRAAESVPLVPRPRPVPDDRPLDDLDELLEADARSRSGPADPPGRRKDRPSEAAEERTPAGPRATGGAPAAETVPQEEETVPQRPSAADLEAAALRDGRAALAGWIRTAAGRPDAEARARHATAIALEMTEFAGRMSAAYVQTAHGLDGDALAGDPAGQVLAWASAIRSGVVQPTGQSTELLRRPPALVAARPGLAALGEEFRRAADDGVYLRPGVCGRLRDTVRAEEHRAEQAGHAQRMLAEGPAKRIKYQLATEVLKLVLHEEGEVGRLLAIVAADEAGRAGEARRGVDALRVDGVERLIDAATRELSPRGSKRRIVAGARRKLREHIDEALDIVNRWSGAVGEQTATRTDGAAGSDPQRVEARLADLRRAAFDLRDRCLAELDGLAGARDPVLGAAASLARRLVEDALALLDMRPPGAEPRQADQVVGRDLLLAPGIAVVPGSLEPAAVPTLADLSAVVAAAPDWTAAFEARAERGDHVGTEAIIGVLRDGDPRRAAALERRRASLVELARRDQHARVEKLRDQLARLRRDSVIGEQDATGLEGMLRPLTDPGRTDFDQMGRRLDEVEGRIGELTEREMDKVRRRLADDLGHPATAATAARIAEYLDGGDLTTAREFLLQARQGRPLPEAPSDPGHFARFFPAFPRVFDALQPPGRRAADPSPAIDALIEALQGDGRVADARLREALAEAGLDLAASRRRDLGREALRMWRAAGAGPKPGGNLKTMIEPILRLIGLEGDQRPGLAAKARSWIELTGVRWHGPALLPAFGSRMSPSGDTLRLLLVWNRPGPGSIVGLLKDEPHDQTVLVWYFGTLSPGDRRALAEAARRHHRPVAVLDNAAIGYLACLPEADWGTTVTLLAPFASSDPFAATGDVPDEMFYGRDEQLRQVIDRAGGSFVYGGRQLGKSALLQAARRQVGDGDPHRVVIFKSISDVGRTAPAEAIWPTLRRRLADAGIVSPALPGAGGPEGIRQAVREWIAGDPRRQLLILLDEADEFLDRDAEGAVFANVGALRDLMSETERRVKVVFAGLHQTARFKSLSNQPLAHLGTPISVGPLAPQDAFDLLTRPLATLGFRLPETLAARIITQANNAPALIQLFASALLRQLRGRPVGERSLPYEVTRDDVDAVWADAGLAEGFRERFEWTINLDQRYKVIAYTVALNAQGEDAEAALPVGRLYAECRDLWWPRGFADCSLDAFQGLLDESVELGILVREGDRYRLRTPYILDLLGGAEQVEQVLTRAQDLEPPDSFDVHSYRPAYLGGPDRSPLTGGQVSRLLTRANLVHVIAGSAALHLEQVPKALQDEEERHENVRVVTVRPGGSTFEGAVEDARGRPGHSLVVIALRGRTLAQAQRQIRQAGQVLSRHRGAGGGTLAVVFTVPPELAPVWLAARESGGPGPLLDLGGRAELMELRRFDAAAVRQWMREAAHAFQNRRGQEDLLARTGGWPTLISTVLAGEMVADQDRALDRCRRYLHERPAELVAAAGLRCCPPVAAAWYELVDIMGTGELAGSGEPADLADLLAPSAAEDDHPLSGHSLRHHGYRTITDVIEVLRTLGALIPAAHAPHELQCEPVLAEATRRAAQRA
ncbi:hypothetical protein SAMN04489712_113155 [Thermomonospora echinospora]|uniref:Uncharacterized protein n=1 Tax=Thermomonospora echinospora TaxID=1992 RepID=A0A1H6D6T1_9ACTN|nr:hypothetical protein [Thermomonospora echinospora]SEG80804.1 hypothetical protein SAMN04489712_113155 [Thermomonospora echinospora]